MTPNRVATILAVIAGILTAVTPVVANMDWSSTAGVIAGGTAAVLAILKWLDGWQKHEHNLADIEAAHVIHNGMDPEDEPRLRPLR